MEHVMGTRVLKFRLMCADINECQLGVASCLQTQRCDNTIGSYQCIRYSGCGTGYTLNAATGNCEGEVRMPLRSQWRTGRRASEMESYEVCVSARETDRDRRDPRPCISLALTHTP